MAVPGHSQAEAMAAPTYKIGFPPDLFGGTRANRKGRVKKKPGEEEEAAAKSPEAEGDVPTDPVRKPGGPGGPGESAGAGAPVRPGVGPGPRFTQVAHQPIPLSLTADTEPLDLASRRINSSSGTTPIEMPSREFAGTPAGVIDLQSKRAVNAPKDPDDPVTAAFDPASRETVHNISSLANDKTATANAARTGAPKPKSTKLKPVNLPDSTTVTAGPTAQSASGVMATQNAARTNIAAQVQEEVQLNATVGPKGANQMAQDAVSWSPAGIRASADAAIAREEAAKKKKRSESAKKAAATRKANKKKLTPVVSVDA